MKSGLAQVHLIMPIIVTVCVARSSHNFIVLAFLPQVGGVRGSPPPPLLTYLPPFIPPLLGLSKPVPRPGNNGVSRYPSYQKIFWLTENFN